MNLSAAGSYNHKGDAAEGKAREGMYEHAIARFTFNLDRDKSSVRESLFRVCEVLV